MVYCGSGVTACVNLLSQAVAGRPPGQALPGGLERLVLLRAQ
jgi:thiosulfate/3-mercaptopyruvate sulfurtransferase